MSANKWMSKLTKDFGQVASGLKKNEPQIIPSWSPSLNWATGIGGFKPGKINILYGPESSGKSMLSMMAIVELQKRDPEAIGIWFDSEFSFNTDFFIRLGGDADRLIVRKSNNPLMIFDYIGGELLELLQDGAPVKAIVIDSIRSIRYPKDMKKQSTDMVMGGTGANYLPSAFKMILPVIHENNLLTFCVQQVSIQIDPMKALRNPYVLPDGQALKHAADLMLEITKLDTKAGVIEKGETIAGGAAQLGHKVRVKVRKNRMGMPARVAQFTFHYEKGIMDRGGEIFELAKSLGIIKHPINPDTGKENNQMWVFENDSPVRGEQNMKNLVISDRFLQERVINSCYSFQDSKTEVDELGFVEDSEESLVQME